MNLSFKILLVCVPVLWLGCAEDDYDKPIQSKALAEANAIIAEKNAPPPPKPESALHELQFVHQWPDGADASSEAPRGANNPFMALDGVELASRNGAGGATQELQFQFTLVDQKDKKDVYNVRRQLRMKIGGGDSDQAWTTGPKKNFTVEFDGTPVAVFEDEFGVATFQPLGSAPAASEEADATPEAKPTEESDSTE